MKNLVVPGIVLLLICQNGSAQTVASSVLNTAGSSFVINNLSIEWSVGETPCVETMVSSQQTALLTNGFLQPLTMKSNTLPVFQSEEIIILPNPSPDWVDVNILTAQKGKLHFALFDAGGKQVWSTMLSCNGTGQIQRINIRHFAAGAYFLSAQLDPDPGSVAKKGSYKILKF
jgi:hypothetical protein